MVKIRDYNAEDKDWVEVEPGTYAALINCVYDCGFQAPYQNIEGELARHKLVVGFELDEFLPDSTDKRYILQAQYTVSLHPKSVLRPVVNAAFPTLTDEQKDEFDMDEMIGRPVMVTVTHKENGRAKIAQVAPMPKGMKAPKWKPMEHESVWGLASYLQGQEISAEAAATWNVRAKALKNNKPATADSDDDIPF